MMKDKLARLKKVAERAQKAHREMDADITVDQTNHKQVVEEFHDAMNAYHEDFTNVGDSVPTVLRLIEALEIADTALLKIARAAGYSGPDRIREFGEMEEVIGG